MGAGDTFLRIQNLFDMVLIRNISLNNSKLIIYFRVFFICSYHNILDFSSLDCSALDFTICSELDCMYLIGVLIRTPHLLNFSQLLFIGILWQVFQCSHIHWSAAYLTTVHLMVSVLIGRLISRSDEIFENFQKFWKLVCKSINGQIMILASNRCFFKRGG